MEVPRVSTDFDHKREPTIESLCLRSLPFRVPQLAAGYAAEPVRLSAGCIAAAEENPLLRLSGFSTCEGRDNSISLTAIRPRTFLLPQLLKPGFEIQPC